MTYVLLLLFVGAWLHNKAFLVQNESLIFTIVHNVGISVCLHCCWLLSPVMNHCWPCLIAIQTCLNYSPLRSKFPNNQLRCKLRILKGPITLQVGSQSSMMASY